MSVCPSVRPSVRPSGNELLLPFIFHANNWETQLLGTIKSQRSCKNFWIWTIRWSVLLTGSTKWYFRVFQVPVVQLSRNLAEIFIKTIEAQESLNFVDSLVLKYTFFPIWHHSGKSSSFMLDMTKMRNLRYIHVPVVQLSRNLAEIFIKTIEAQ